MTRPGCDPSPVVGIAATCDKVEVGDPQSVEGDKGSEEDIETDVRVTSSTSSVLTWREPLKPEDRGEAGRYPDLRVEVEPSKHYGNKGINESKLLSTKEELTRNHSGSIRQPPFITIATATHCRSDSGGYKWFAKGTMR